MTSLGEFGKQANAFPAALDRARKAGTLKVAQGVTDAARRNTRRIASSGRLSGVGKSGARVDVRYQQAPSGDYLVQAVGPYQLIERDTHGHRIPKTLDQTNSKRQARQRRAGFRGRKPLHIPGIGYRTSVHHPGTRGKHPFERAVDEYGKKAAQVYLQEIRAAADRTFR